MPAQQFGELLEDDVGGLAAMGVSDGPEIVDIDFDQRQAAFVATVSGNVLFDQQVERSAPERAGEGILQGVSPVFDRAQTGAQLGHYFLRIQRLCQIGVGAIFEPAHLVLVSLLAVSIMM